MKLLLPLIAFCLVKTVTSLFCHWNTGCLYKYHSNLTPYNSIRGDIRDALVKISNFPTGCEAVSIWGLIRHGKINPGKGFEKPIKDALVVKDYIVSSYNKGHSSLCAQDVENLRNWVDEEKILEKPLQISQEGHQEMIGISRRLNQAFPKLLSKLGKNDYIFRHGKEKWVKDSANGFVEGLSNKKLIIQRQNTDIDVLAAYDSCNKYNKEVRHNDETNGEAIKFLSTPEYLVSKDRIQRRLGIDYTLTDANITALYDLCRYFSSGIDTKLNPWCSLFTTADLKALEYRADLEQYYKSGYGVSMSEIFGQYTLADLLKSFQAAKSRNGKKITAYFSHGAMLDMVYTALKLFKDDTPLTGAVRNSKRKWTSSTITAFSSNLLVVLNKCKTEGNDDYNVTFYLNEEPLLQICKQGVCSWKEFEDLLRPFLEIKIDFCE